MKARARSFRRRLEELGSVSGPVIAANVRDRLRSRPLVSALPPAQGELADEIVALLENTKLSSWQAHELQWEFFGQ